MAYQFFHIEAYSLQAKSYEREITIKKKKEPRQARKNQENRDKKPKRNHGGASSNR